MAEMGHQKKCVDIGDLGRGGGGGAKPTKKKGRNDFFWGGGEDVIMQFAQGICTLYGQNKAKP
jgi:hypothetical protein